MTAQINKKREKKRNPLPTVNIVNSLDKNKLDLVKKNLS